MDERSLIRQLRQRNLSLYAVDFNEALKALDFVLDRTVRPQRSADHLALRRIKQWIIDQCQNGSWEHDELFAVVADLAVEASGPAIKNPMAMLIHLLKKELDYDGQGRKAPKASEATSESARRSHD